MLRGLLAVALAVAVTVAVAVAVEGRRLGWCGGIRVRRGGCWAQGRAGAGAGAGYGHGHGHGRSDMDQLLADMPELDDALPEEEPSKVPPYSTTIPPSHHTHILTFRLHPLNSC